MALQVVSPAVSVYKETGIKDGQMQTEEHVFKRGAVLPDWVSTHQQFVLMTTGMARQVGDLPDPTLRADEDMPAPVVLPEHNPLSVVADHTVTGPMVVTKRVGAEGSSTSTGSAPAASRKSTPEGELPADSDIKPVWEQVAEDYGVPRAEAESMRKPDLIREVKARRDAREKARAEAESDPDGKSAK